MPIEFHTTEILDLYIGRKKTGISIRPDPVCPSMWRIHQGDRVSDMVNLARAKDAARSWAQPRSGQERLAMHWRLSETGAEACQSGFDAAAE